METYRHFFDKKREEAKRISEGRNASNNVPEFEYIIGFSLPVGTTASVEGSFAQIKT